MLSVEGVVYISPKVEVRESPGKGGDKYFHFLGIGKNPYNDGIHYYKVQLYIKQQYLDAARETIQTRRTIWIRIGELKGMRAENAEELKGLYTSVTSKWEWIEPLVQNLTKEK